MGTGGVAGDVSFPEHMENYHIRLLYGGWDDFGGVVPDDIGVPYNVEAAMREAWEGGNPHTAVTAHDVTAEMDASETSVTGFRSAVTGINPDTDIDDVLARAISEMSTGVPFQFQDPSSISDADAILTQAVSDMNTGPFADHSVPGANIISTSAPASIADIPITSVDKDDPVDIEDVTSTTAQDVDSAVTAFEARSRTQYLQAASRVMNGFFTANAGSGTQMSVALALLEAERQNQLDDYDQQLRVEQVRLNYQAAMAKRELSLNQALQHAQLALQADMSNSQLQAQAAIRQLELKVQRDLTVYQALQQQAGQQAQFDQRQIELEEQWSAQRMQSTVQLFASKGDVESRLEGVRTQIEDSRARAAIGLASAMYQAYDGILGKQMAGFQASTMLQMDHSKTRIAAEQDEINWNLHQNVKEALWDLEIFSYGTQVLGSVAGAPSIRERDLLDRALQIGGLGISAVTGVASMALPLIGMLSDARAKRDIHDIPDALDKLLGLRGKQYHYRSGFGEDEHVERMGFIAQEVEEIFPEWTNHSHAGYMYITVHPLDVAALIVESIRELTERVAALEKKL